MPLTAVLSIGIFSNEIIPLSKYADDKVEVLGALAWIVGLLVLLAVIIGGFRFWSLRTQQLISQAQV
jgi:hypothetical protein